MQFNLIAKSLVLFFVAGLCEIGGGYLVWLWRRNEKGIWLGALGGLVLFLYGIIPTLQPAHFGRVDTHVYSFSLTFFLKLYPSIPRIAKKKRWQYS
jgi:small multidrug resistance family-3 protein